MYWLRRRLYSQNFFTNRELIQKLIRSSSISSKDTVLEIGAGSGFITRELAKTVGKVTAIEIDPQLCRRLRVDFIENTKVKIINADWLGYRVPEKNYKVFSNIPFAITADIVRKLTSDGNFVEGYLIIQKEAAEKFIGMPYATKNTMMAILIKPFFEMDVVWRFNESDFVPRPNVDSVLLRIKRIEEPVIEKSMSDIYKDFVVYGFSRKKVGKWSFGEWMRRFEYFVRKVSPEQKRIVRQKARKFLADQSKNQKINRTRRDKNWRE